MWHINVASNISAGSFARVHKSLYITAKIYLGMCTKDIDFFYPPMSLQHETLCHKAVQKG